MVTAPNHFDRLKRTLLDLEPVGSAGFEGLMAAVLSQAVGMPFRLAKSGTQRGRDGETGLDHGSVAFEAKLYTGDIPKSALITKIADLALDDRGQVDLWILGATSPVSAQDAKDIRELGERFALGTLILDWTPPLPPLAALIAMQTETTVAFLAQHIAGLNEAALRTALDAVRNDSLFPALSDRIQSMLRAPAVGLALAYQANIQWLTARFSHAAKARAAFGQALAPGDPGGRTVLDRSTLRTRLAHSLSEPADNKIIFLLGAEGNGKSWLFAQTWLNLATKPLSIALTPDDIKSTAPEDIRHLLLTKLLAQTDQVPSEATTNRWLRYFKGWTAGANPASPNFVVFLDGINQRPQFDWRRFLESLQDIVSDMHGRAVVTCRSVYYQDRIEGRLLAGSLVIAVPEWNDAELNILLGPLGTSVAKLKPQVARSLRNPRIFSVAVDLLSQAQIEDFAELSVNRLLFEYIRKNARDSTDAPAVTEFVQHLRRHAEDIVQRLAAAQTDDVMLFDRGTERDGDLRERLLAASEGRFIETISGDTTRYVLKEDGLPLALGLTLIGSLQKAERNERDLEEALNQILNPISALDKTADVVLAAVLVAVLDKHCSSSITGVLTSAFVRLQNLDTKAFDEFCSLGRQAPQAFLNALETVALSDRTAGNLDWLEGALLNARTDATAWPIIARCIQRWLSL